MNLPTGSMFSYRSRYLTRYLMRAWHILSTEGGFSLYNRLRRRLTTTPLRVARFARIPTPIPDYHPDLSSSTSSAPEVTIIIPVYNNSNYTRQCLYALERQRSRYRIEVVVVDDGSTDNTATLLSETNGIVVLRHEQNKGFVKAANYGARIARGKILVFLNNDTQVLPDWLDALIDTFAQDSRAGIVGSCLLYPNGRLQEAGCILFEDATAWNFGHLDNPYKPEYRYLRQVDYVSGASLAIPRQLFQELGGFDELFSPGYYEDADLALSAREKGYRIYYQPFSQVLHFESISSDCSKATKNCMKRHQTINQEKFQVKWTQTLRGCGLKSDGFVFQKERYVTNRVLIIDTYMITPDRESGSVRLFNIIRILLENDCKVTFGALNLEAPEPYVSQLQRLGVEVLYRPCEKSLKRYIRKLGNIYDFVILCRADTAFELLDLALEACKPAKIIYDTVDLHFLREQRLAQLIKDARLQAIALSRERQELELIRKASTTLVVSSFEYQLLRDKVPNADIRILSNIHFPSLEITPFAERQDILFIGNFNHPPNVDGIIWFCESIFPLILAKLARIRLLVVGTDPGRGISRLENESISVLGHVPEIQPFLNRCRVSVAPLRYGAGVKGKINESMAAGLPVVTTSVGAEGMFLVDGQSALIADNGNAFAEKTLRLYQDALLWEQISRAGVNSVKQHFSSHAAERTLRELSLVQER